MCFKGENSRTPNRVRLENCFNGRTIKTNRRIESGYDKKANVKFERERERERVSNVKARREEELRRIPENFLQEAGRVARASIGTTLYTSRLAREFHCV